MYSVYFSTHCDREQDETMFAVLAGLLVWPKKLRRRLKLA